MESYINEKQKMQYEYILSLTNPFQSWGSKCPSALPIDTATAHIEYNTDFSPNASGKFLVVCDPHRSDISIYNDSALTGLTAAGAATTFSLGQDVDIIDMYRLVSYGIRLTYQGDLQTHKGYLIAAVTSNLSNVDFRIFSNVEDIHNKQKLFPLEGVYLKYLPVDPEQLDFKTQTIFSGNTHPSLGKQVLVIYGSNLPSTASFRLDIVRNIEYISKPNKREYINHTCGFTSNISNIDMSLPRSNQISKA